MTSNQIPDSNITKFQMPSKHKQSINFKLKKKKGKSCIKKTDRSAPLLHTKSSECKIFKLHKITHRRYPSIKYLNANKI